ncbi:hypothetical protein ASE61_19470 [Bosea sp. Root670]|uniref:hypothetical protein n=1 Tax=Bosea sp. Root670 TaxID=1736583 RepID=UPI000713BFDF|nr:hypothetical protein [Bosea sp. Root670]KRE00652.1 hypothetical protein ASE61_19470 [Bosea sp. Root670]
MDAGLHRLAPHHLPAFITAPGESDTLMVVTAAILVAAVLGVGLLFLRLHTLPERMAHKSQKLQFEIVAVLGLLALFTHVHLFWVAGLILALIDIPDFSGLFGRMAHALERIAGRRARGAAAEGDEAQVPTASGHAANAEPPTKRMESTHA